jgi:hypothetical protein
MGVFGALFGSTTYGEKNLVKAYLAQDSLKKYDYETFAILECSKQNISPDLFFNIFVKAHESLNNKRALTEEEYGIFIEAVIQLKLGEINQIDFFTFRTMNVPKIKYEYETFLTFSQPEREIISNISSQMWRDKVDIFHNENRLSDNDDAYRVINKHSNAEKDIWKQYIKELHQRMW